MYVRIIMHYAWAQRTTKLWGSLRLAPITRGEEVKKETFKAYADIDFLLDK